MVSKKTLEEADIVREVGKEKQSAKKWLVMIVLILVASFLRAVSVYSFVVPNNFAPGGVTGLAAIFEYKLHVNAGYFLAALNAPLVVVAFVFVNKKFAAISTSAIFLSSGLIVLFEKLHFPTFVSAATGADQVLPALAGGILGGTGIALMLKAGGSCGGTDIIATIVQKKYSATNVAWFIFLMDSTVVLASAFVYDDAMVPVLLSFVQMFVSSKMAETILSGFKSAIKFEVITSHPEEFSQEVISLMHRSVTMVEAKGMYTGENHALLICIVSKRQMSAFREVLKKFPDSFAYISNTSEIFGYWKNK